MKIKITHPIPKRNDLKVGFIYDVTVKEAQPWIEQDWAFPVIEEKPKKKEAEDDDGQNGS